MKITSNILLSIFILALILDIFNFPGGSALRLLSLIGLLFLSVIATIKGIRLKKDLEKSDFHLTLLINLFSVSSILFLIFKMMYWWPWQTLQVLPILFIFVVGFTYFQNQLEMRKHLGKLISKQRFISFISIVGFVFIFFPYSTYVYWDHIRSVDRLPNTEENVELKCQAYSRYIWALKNEGKKEKAEIFRKKKYDFCASTFSKSKSN